jgi:hypothetical protein
VNRSYYSAEKSDFIKTSPEAIFGTLARHYNFALEGPQKRAWSFQIEHLKKVLGELPSGYLFLEFEIPRIGRRADAILVVEGVIFILEYKYGASHYDQSSIDQVIDYALDLKNFHAGSHYIPIVPVLVATNAPPKTWTCEFSQDRVANILLANETSLSDLLISGLDLIKAPPLSPAAWANSAYQPTPTIVEAAQALYRGHRVSSIARSDAGAINLTRTASCVTQIIDEAKRDGKKALCLITGVPGAGKTLAGLNIATERMRTDQASHAVFLSGNDPLVKVLREALAIDAMEQSKISMGRSSLRKGDVRRRAHTFIQNIRHFRDDNYEADAPPVEKVVVFDEAQRAWHQEQLSSFMLRKRGVPSFDLSEPEFLLSVMDRHTDWCCVICLVGGGQEINTGEAGMVEWLSALESGFPHWSIHCSSQIQNPEYDWTNDLSARLRRLGANIEPDLHLAVSLRSFRAEHVSAFVGALIIGDAGKARNLYGEVSRYPMVVTRKLQRAKEWIRSQARGSERIGLLASSNAIRLKPEGIFVKQDLDPAQWFLKGKDDIRSSYYLEDVATEFHVQGLELDWALVCWDLNFRRTKAGWKSFSFAGTRWQTVGDHNRTRYVANSYRVLLTRARQGFVIFVPEGNPQDPTREPATYAAIYDFLRECGIEAI